MKKTIAILAMMVVLASCTKEHYNDRKLGGVWLGKKVEYITYENNELVKDSTVTNTGAMYLFDDDELYNQISHSLLIPPPFTDTWEGQDGNQNTLFGLNIRRFTKNKLELSINETDSNLNHLKMTVWYFERE